jgi:hypothetical protein
MSDNPLAYLWGVVPSTKARATRGDDPISRV